jgi:hypothetical protein
MGIFDDIGSWFSSSPMQGPMLDGSTLDLAKSSPSWLSSNASWLVPTALTAGTAAYGLMANNSAAGTQANALNNATAANTTAANNSLAFLRDAYNTTRQDQAPWLQAGQNALGTYAGQLGTQYQQSPGYQFRFNEGQRAVQNGAAANGMINSGATAKALTRFGQGIAADDYGQWMNRQAALAGVGQTAATQSGQAAGQYGGQAAGVSTNLGNAIAGNTANIGNVYGNAQTAGANNLAGGANSLLKYASATPGFWG